MWGKFTPAGLREGEVRDNCFLCHCDPQSLWIPVSVLLIYKPAFGFLCWLTGCPLLAEDVNQGLIRYVMHEEKVQETMDSFHFLVKDSKPNVVSGNIFHVQWSLLSFTHTR